MEAANSPDTGTLSISGLWRHLAQSINQNEIVVAFYGDLVTSKIHSRLSKFRLTMLTKFTLFTNPSARAGYDTRSIFKRSLTGLNSEFSFS